MNRPPAVRKVRSPVRRSNRDLAAFTSPVPGSTIPIGTVPGDWPAGSGRFSIRTPCTAARV